MCGWVRVGRIVKRERRGAGRRFRLVEKGEISTRFCFMSL
jgi:hypothetical protein